MSLGLTSNLGARRFGRGRAGYRDHAASARAHFTAEVRAFVRPELLNRIDRIVPFLPLERASLEALARRELRGIAGRQGLAAPGVTLEVSEPVLERLVRSKLRRARSRSGIRVGTFGRRWPARLRARPKATRAYWPACS